MNQLKFRQTDPSSLRTTALGLVTAFLVVSGSTGCSENSPETDLEVVQRGSRVLGISISDREDNDFNSAFVEAQNAGMQLTSLSVGWDDVEVSPGVYNPAVDFLQIANDYYGARGTKLILGLNPIDTNNDRRPTHLAGLNWDDQTLIDAYKSLLDWALPKMDDVDLLAFSIGNEIDATLGGDADWQQYSIFFQETAAHARSLRQNLRVGTKITYDGLTSGQRSNANNLNQHTDVVLTTYYPLNSDFTIKSPDIVFDVFDTVTNQYPQRSIIFAEIGSPSSPNCGSSESSQAEFYRKIFSAWDEHAGQVEALELTWMHDISNEAVDIYENYYGLSDACFLEYLGTLGMKSYSGSDKAAWSAFEDEANKRGW